MFADLTVGLGLRECDEAATRHLLGNLREQITYMKQDVVSLIIRITSFGNSLELKWSLERS